MYGDVSIISCYFLVFSFCSPLLHRRRRICTHVHTRAHARLVHSRVTNHESQHTWAAGSKLCIKISVPRSSLECPDATYFKYVQYINVMFGRRNASVRPNTTIVRTLTCVRTLRRCKGTSQCQRAQGRIVAGRGSTSCFSPWNNI